VKHGCEIYIIQQNSRNLICIALEMDEYGALRRSEWFIRAKARSRTGFLSWIFLESWWYIFRLGDKWKIIMTSIYRLYARESGEEKAMSDERLSVGVGKYKKTIAENLQPNVDLLAWEVCHIFDNKYLYSKPS